MNRLPRTVSALTALALIVPALASTAAWAVPFDDVTVNPHPAAPRDGCAVTQDVDATTVVTDGVTLSNPKVKIHERVTHRSKNPKKKGWRTYTSATVTFTTTGSATATAFYASTDCAVPERSVVASAKRSGKVSFTINAHAISSSKKTSRKVSRSRVVAKAKKYSLPHAKTLVSEKALLKARTRFIASLPTRPLPSNHSPVTKLTAKQACPTKLAVGTQKQSTIAHRPATIVPQFDDPAAMWVCRYPFDEKFGSLTRTKVTGAAQRRVMAGLRGMTTPSPTQIPACTADLAGRTLISLVSKYGEITGVVMDDFGCNDVRMTSSPATRRAGAKDSPGVPKGTFVPTTTLYRALGQIS